MTNIQTEIIVREILENEPDNTIFGEVLASTIEYSNNYPNLERQHLVAFIKAKRDQFNKMLNRGLLIVPKATERMIGEATGNPVFNQED